VARILVVEDNDPVRWTLTTLLRSNGYEVDQAADGQQALNCFANHPTDVVLIDLHMPVMDGLEACQRLRQASQVPILLISTYNHPVIYEQARDCGADAFIPKPMQFDDLLHWVRDVSEGGGGPDPPNNRAVQPLPAPSPAPSNHEPAGPAPGLPTSVSGLYLWHISALCQANQPVPSPALPGVQPPAVHTAGKFDLSPPFEYTICSGA
jgi:CheY-like chemotaxis protein